MTEANKRTRDYYLKEYSEKGRSPIDIAKEWGTYPNKIRRELKKFGIKARTKSEAQQLALQSGRNQHPTEGTKRSESVKMRISAAMAESWASLDKQGKEHRSEIARQQWQAMSDEERETLRMGALEALREAAKKGSKIERAVFESLTKLGYTVEYHSEHIIPGEDLQADLYFPGLKIVVEIDGPAHVYPVWGPEALAKTKESDEKKNQYLLSFGFTVIRLRCLARTSSMSNERKAVKKLVEILEDVKNNIKDNNISAKLIEVEI